MSQDCTLVATAFNEAARIEQSLDRLVAEPLPAGLVWREFVVLAGASTDGTPDLARAWGERHPEIPVRVATTPERLGKSADLAACHAQLLATRPADEIICLIDADVLPEPGATAALLGCLLADVQLDIVWGVDLPDLRDRGRRASAFQLEVTYELAKHAGNQPRAWGRFYAYRLGAMGEFTWKSGFVAEDTQVSWYATEHRLHCRTEMDALVLTRPAKGYRDFYLQTYRTFRALDLTPEDAPETAPRGSPSHQLRAILRAAAKDPVGAVAYGTARVVCAVMHRASGHVIRDDWTQSVSTKEAPLA